MHMVIEGGRKELFFKGGQEQTVEEIQLDSQRGKVSQLPPPLFQLIVIFID